MLSYHTLPSSLSPRSCHCFLVALLVAHKVAHEGSSCAPFKILLYIKKHIKKPIVKIDSGTTVHSIQFHLHPLRAANVFQLCSTFIPLRVNSHCPAVRPYRFCDRSIVFCFRSISLAGNSHCPAVRPYWFFCSFHIRSFSSSFAVPVPFPVHFEFLLHSLV